MLGFDQLTIEKLLYEQNQASMQAALKVASVYNRTIIVRAHTHSLIRQWGETLDFPGAVHAYKACSSTVKNDVLRRQPLIAYCQELAQYYFSLEKLNFTRETTPAMSAIRKTLNKFRCGKPASYDAAEQAALQSGYLHDINRRYAPLLARS
jgi:hypothetical protein